MEGKEIYGAVIFVVAALTDFLDGYFARKRNQVTAIGKLLDPIADKLLVTSAFISLVELKLAPAWMVVIIVGREFAVSGIRSIAASRGFLMPANWLGKTKMVLQTLTVVVLIMADTYIEPWLTSGRLLLWITVVVSLVSAGNYLIIFLKLMNQPIGNAGIEDYEREKRREERKEKIVS
jgi:CDP-diacylglycerol---glycerol-3-phosphate 3-phosphatidyltransferase